MDLIKMPGVIRMNCCYKANVYFIRGQTLLSFYRHHHFKHTFAAFDCNVRLGTASKCVSLPTSYIQQLSFISKRGSSVYYPKKHNLITNYSKYNDSLKALKLSSPVSPNKSILFATASPLKHAVICNNNGYIQRRQFSSQTEGGLYKALSESAPVLYTQDALVYFHDLSGLPWWTTIVITTVTLRMLVTFPLALYQNYIVAKVENLSLEMPDIVKELKSETAYAIKKYNWSQQYARATYNRSIKKQWNKLIIRDNCHPAKASILLFVQLPLWVLLSVALRNLVYMLPVQDAAAQITCLELSVGGFLWIPNLLVPDASWILPVAFGITNLIIIELQTLSKVRKRGRFQKYATIFFRGICIIMIPVAASVPSCMNLYWATSSVFGLLQNLVLLSPRVKQLTGIPNTPSTLENPYRYIASQLQERAHSFNSRNKAKE